MFGQAEFRHVCAISGIQLSFDTDRVCLRASFSSNAEGGLPVA
jgi:hypothetical protein